MAINSTLGAKCAAEFVGTFLLIFTMGCNTLSDNVVWGGVSTACVLMVSTYALHGISGANFNPAVTLALGISKACGGPGLHAKPACAYVLVQAIAGVLGALSYATIFRTAFDLGPAAGFGLLHVGLCEAIYCFLICFVVLNVSAARSVKDNQYYGLAISFAYLAGAYGAGAISGGCFNPALALGIDAASGTMGAGWWAKYMTFQVAGAVLAAFMFRLVRPDEFGGCRGVASSYLSESLGTFMLVVTVGLNALGASPAGPLAIAASYMCSIYALGDISGAHFNSAVSLAMVISGRLTDEVAPKIGKYVVFQAFGGICAACVYSVIYKGVAFPLAPSVGFGWMEVAMSEILFTAFLCFTVLCVAVSPSTRAPTMFGLVIGFVLTVAGNAIGTVSGGSLNPALSLAVACADYRELSRNVLFYISFELLGAVFAAGLFRVTHSWDLKDDKDVDPFLCEA